MHVMGARFETLAAANAALQDVRSAAAVAPGDVAVRPLGSTQYEVPATAFVLGGRFADGDVKTVLRIFDVHGGSMIVCRPDAPTAAAGHGAANRAAVASNPLWTAAWTAASSHPRADHRAARTKPGPRLRTRLRRPVARLRGRAARAHGLADGRQ